MYKLSGAPSARVTKNMGKYGKIINQCRFSWENSYSVNNGKLREGNYENIWTNVKNICNTLENIGKPSKTHYKLNGGLSGKIN